MRPYHFALWSTFVLVLLPTTLAASFGALLGLAWSLDALAGPDSAGRHAAALAVLALIGAGWFGIVTLWRLFIGLLRARLPKNPRIVWAGLAAGSLVSLCLVLGVSGGSPARLVFAWPLLAALHYGNEFSKTFPLTAR